MPTNITPDSVYLVLLVMHRCGTHQFELCGFPCFDLNAPERVEHKWQGVFNVEWGQAEARKGCGGSCLVLNLCCFFRPQILTNLPFPSASRTSFVCILTCPTQLPHHHGHSSPVTPFWYLLTHFHAPLSCCRPNCQVTGSLLLDPL